MTENMVKAEYQRRVKLIQDLMESMDLDAVLMTATAMQTFQLPVKFFSNVLNGRLIQNGQHGFRHGLRDGQKSRSHPCCRNYRFFYAFHFNLRLIMLLLT